ncbi:MAG: 2-oxo acid dehydrogenase subunit E2 [Halobacteriales archaeon]|nr:2-oxo acid dehydrogenase subunit E2 [Halobacteriales archaeon]
MPHEFKLPDVGEGVAEGELVAWLVEVGDAVSEDQPVAEVETDKALVEVPSPVNGTVRERMAEEGEIMNVGEVFITFDVEGEPVEPDADDGADAAEEADDDAAAEPSGGDGRVFAAPTVRRLARELDVALEAVEGTGPSGRITESDVRAAAEGDGAPEPTPDAEPAEAPTSTTTPASAAGRDRTLAAPATRQLARELGVDLDAVPASEERDGEPFVTPADVEAFAEAGGEAAQPAGAPETHRVAAGTEERVPYRGVRRTIGEAMENSASSIPHVTHHELLDAEALVEARRSLKPHAEERGIQLTYLPFVMKAATAALKEFPYVNSSLDETGEEIVLKGEYNLGVAVATDDALYVPVVDDVDRKGLLQIASEVNELAGKARDRTIAREEMQGGTFTLTNFGSVGGDYGTPIINYPEAAILGLGAIKQRPYVVDGEVEARYTLPISMSVDHRLIDGAKAARFVARLAEFIEEPTLLLLD